MAEKNNCLQQRFYAIAGSDFPQPENRKGNLHIFTTNH
jgi:hypothetical protein